MPTDKKITDLPSNSVTASTDVIPIVDLSGNVTQKMTLTQLAAAIVTYIVNGAISGLKLTDTTVTPQKLTNPYRFSAYNSTSTSIAASFVPTKILFQTEEYDPNSNFASSTYTAPVAGYYQFTGLYHSQAGADGEYFTIYLYKNGALHKEGSSYPVRNANAVGCIVSPPPVYLAAGDTVEIWGATNSGGAKGTTTGASSTYFGGYLVGIS